MKIAFAKPDQASSGTFVVAVTEDRKLTPSAAALDKKTGGVLTRAMASSRFRGRKNELLEILAPKGVPISRIVLVGLGKPEQIDAQRMQEVGGNLVATLNRSGESVATMQVDN